MPPNHAIVIGAGIAGCATAHALAKYGCQVTLIERHGEIAQEASGNPLGVLYPRLAGHPSPQDDLALESYLYTTTLLKSLHLSDTNYQACGVLQLGFNAREQGRLQAMLARTWPAGLLQAVSAEQASEIAGIHLAHRGIFLPDAGWVNPAAFCNALAQHQNIRVLTHHCAVQIERVTGGWQVRLQQTQALSADFVVIANANDAKQFSQSQHLPLQAVRGQVTVTHPNPLSQALRTVVCTEGYITPAVNQSHCIGASFVVGTHDLAIEPREHDSNLAMLATLSPDLSASFAGQPLQGRVSLRCSSPDYLPLVGPLLDTEQLSANPPRPSASADALPWLQGLCMHVGHGSKGLTTAPYCAELLAMQLLAPASLPLPALYAQLNPNRFALRTLGLKRLATAPYFR